MWYGGYVMWIGNMWSAAQFETFLEKFYRRTDVKDSNDNKTDAKVC
jgi:hypothetical protein